MPPGRYRSATALAAPAGYASSSLGLMPRQMSISSTITSVSFSIFGRLFAAGFTGAAVSPSFCDIGML